MRTKSLLRALAAALVLWLVVPGFLAGCGGGGPHEPQYALTIDEPPSLTTALFEVTLTGDGFLPPESTCDGDCIGLLPAPVFGQLGPYTLGWRNDANGDSGTLVLRWICNCGGNAPHWIGSMPLVPGANRITVTMTAGGYTQSASVTITRT
jgi:hypothetical protein